MTAKSNHLGPDEHILLRADRPARQCRKISPFDSLISMVVAFAIVRTLCLILLLALGSEAFVLAQEPSLAPSDLEFTFKVVGQYHGVSWVTLELQANQLTHFQYDDYPDKDPSADTERIKADEGVFFRRGNGRWMKSKDGDATDTPVGEDLNQKLNMFHDVVSTPFAKTLNLDATQGATVWKFIEQSKDKTFTYYTYEKTREHPHLDGAYPRFTFKKAKNDTDGQLFLSRMTAQLRSGEKRIPVTIEMNYYVPLSPGTRVEVFDQVTGKKKYQTVTGPNSGWEIASPQSKPPSNPVAPGT
jgi:hypothetical protein